jgi:uroporphyrinogen-III decarboxylase
MTSKERVLNALNFQKTDTIPIYDIINNKKVYELYGGIDNLDACSDIVGLSSIIYRKLGIDVTRGFYNPKWQIGVVDSWIKYLKVPEKGWVVKYNEDTSWIEERPYKDLDDLNKNMPSAADEKLIEEDFIKSFTSRRDRFAPDVLFIPTIGGFLDLSYRFIDYEMFCLGIFEEPELMDELMDIFFFMQKAYISAYAKHNLGPAFVYCDDIAFKSSLLFSPAFLEKKYFPRLKELFLPAKEKGIKVIYHSDGHLNDIIDDLIACGIDALNPLEKLAGMDIVDIRRKYPKLALVGGIDCSELLSFGTFNDIRKEVERIIRSIGEYGGILLGSTSEIHNGVPPENCKYLYETIKELGAGL